MMTSEPFRVGSLFGTTEITFVTLDVQFMYVFHLSSFDELYSYVIDDTND